MSLHHTGSPGHTLLYRNEPVPEQQSSQTGEALLEIMFLRKQLAAAEIRFYDTHFEHFQMRFLEEAKWHFTEASSCDGVCDYLEKGAAFFGLMSSAGVALSTVTGSWNAVGDSVALDGVFSRIGIRAIAVAGVFLCLGKGLLLLRWPFQKRANEHSTIATNLQRWIYEIAVIRIHLHAPDADTTKAESLFVKHTARLRTLSTKWTSVSMSMPEIIAPSFKGGHLDTLRTRRCSWPIEVGQQVPVGYTSISRLGLDLSLWK